MLEARATHVFLLPIEPGASLLAVALTDWVRGLARKEEEMDLPKVVFEGLVRGRRARLVAHMEEVFEREDGLPPTSTGKLQLEFSAEVLAPDLMGTERWELADDPDIEDELLRVALASVLGLGLGQ